MNDEFIEEYAQIRGLTAERAVAEIVAIIDEVGGKLAGDFVYGYHQRDDVVQQAHVLAYEAFRRGDYDVAKPLDRFLYVHIHNRLSNLKRKQFFRYEAPCKCCDAFNPGAEPCLRWTRWNARNVAKQRLMQLLPLEDVNIAESPEPGPRAIAEAHEFRDAILAAIPESLRDDFAALETETPLPRPRRDHLLAVIREVLGDPDEQTEAD